MLSVDQLIEAMRMRVSMGLDPLDRSRDEERAVGAKAAAAGSGSGSSGDAGDGGLGGELGGEDGDDDLYAIQWAAERVADKVCALACTVPADHLPPRNAEAEAQESRESELDGLRYGPGSLLYFKIESRRWFTGKIDGEGDEFHVIYSEDFGRAMVIQVAVNGGARVMFCGGDHQVAVAILGIDETGDEDDGDDEGSDEFEGNCDCDGDWDCDEGSDES